MTMMMSSSSRGRAREGATYAITEEGRKGPTGLVCDWLEIWDYVGGGSFRGFVAESSNVDHERHMFVFLERPAIGSDLKPGLMSIIELASSPLFECSGLVLGLDRSLPQPEVQTLMRDLGWVGFSLVTLAAWTQGPAPLSSKWLFMAMDM
ncbi:MAG: hypothetical protein M1826_006706 [Phylliscum demangeonii]|nr:MAG: hypothetical protein M1826_006706 [Phylliscum demangeonii]